MYDEKYNIDEMTFEEAYRLLTEESFKEEMKEKTGIAIEYLIEKANDISLECLRERIEIENLADDDEFGSF